MISEEMLVLIILVVILLILIVGGLIFCVEDFNHQRIHNEGYKVLERICGIDAFGRPTYYEVVKYKDGCIKETYIPAEKYFEEMKKSEFN